MIPHTRIAALPDGLENFSGREVGHREVLPVGAVAGIVSLLVFSGSRVRGVHVGAEDGLQAMGAVELDRFRLPRALTTNCLPHQPNRLRAGSMSLMNVRSTPPLSRCAANRHWLKMMHPCSSRGAIKKRAISMPGMVISMQRNRDLNGPESPTNSKPTSVALVGSLCTREIAFGYFCRLRRPPSATNASLPVTE